MKFECAHCGHTIEVEDIRAGTTVECQNCHESTIVPPPIHAPLQPLATTGSLKKRKGSGCAKFLLLLIVLAAGGFGYAMYVWKTSPAQTWDRLWTYAQEFVRQTLTPVPTPTPTPAQTPSPTPRPDPVAWLIEHKDYWPKEAILREPEEFPAVSGGKVVGSLTVPAGAAVTVTDITKQDLGADFMGGTRRLSINATDLRARAQVAFAKAEQEGKSSFVRPTPAAENTPIAAENIREATPDEVRTRLGAFYTHQAATFRIFAPTAKTVSVVLYNDATGNEGRTVRELRSESNNLWSGSVRGDLLGRCYTYLLDERDQKRAREVLDPYATNSVASSSRGRITPMRDPVPPGPKIESPTDAIVYEIHVRDFTIAPNSGVKNTGLYLGWTEQGTRLPADQQTKTALDNLAELGITHAELMPVQDFENDETSGNYNWGYITSAFFSPEGMFATNPNDDSRVRELKELVAALHARGIAVIMDVVYNHTSGNCSLMSIAPEYYYRRATNGTLANGSGCGNEFKSEAPMGRRFILDSLKFWVKEYGIDGFRFDLMALIDQETMREADRELRKLNPSIVLFGEPWTGGASPLQQKTDKGALFQMPVGAFNDDFRNALKGSPDGDDPGWIENGSKRDALKSALLVSDWLMSPTQSINYMTCHDNLVLWDKLRYAMPNASDALRIETMKLGYLALFTAQGVPFIHGGEEFARTKGGNNNSYEAPDSVNEVDWDLKRQHVDLFNYVRDVIALRKAHPMFRLRTKAEVRSRVQFVETGNHDVLMFTINGEGVPNETWKRACVVLNSANESNADVTLPGGEWLIGLDQNGSSATGDASPANGFGERHSQAAAGKLSVRYKSGVVLFQR
jgi:pullulanase